MTASLLRAIYNKTRSFPNYVDFNTYDEDNNPIIKEVSLQPQPQRKACWNIFKQ